jgi:acyl carrier protein
MTAAGKRDYKMLEHRGHSIQDEATSATLVEPLEASVISALRETLALPPEITVDPDTHFSDLGATSVSFLFLSHRLSKLLERKISLSLIIHCQSSRDLARKLQTLGPSPSVETGAILGASNISPIEMDWWHKYQVAPNTSAFNVSLACKLGDSVNTSKLVSAWNEVLAHYKILSCNYYLDQDRAIKRSYQGSSPEAQVVNEIDLDYESHVPFNLEKDRLIRVLCSASTMLVVVSHIIWDLTTLNVLLKNVADVYTGLALKPVRSEYSQTRSSAPPSSVQRKFWCKYLESVRPAMALTTRSQKRASFVGDSHTFTIPNSVYLRIKSYAATHKVTMHQVALGAVALALQVHEEDTDVVIGAPYLNRNWECELETVGLFLQPLPVRIKYPIRIGPNDAPSLNSAPSYMQTVQLASREALSHALPFDQLLSTLGITPTNPDSPLLDVMVTFHEAEHMPVLPIPDVEPVYTWTRGAKFKLMAEFSVTRHGDLMLRLEYSTECLGEEDVEIITKQIVEALQAIVEEESFADAQMRVRQVE